MLKIIASEKVINPGIYNLSSEAYHHGPGISRSGLMEFKRSPYHYWYKHLNPDYIAEPATPAQIFGNALHTYVLEPEKFDQQFFVAPKFDKRTKADASQPIIRK
jgi:exodeoxyribonuclease VIII